MAIAQDVDQTGKALVRKMLDDIEKEISDLKTLHELSTTEEDRKAFGTELEEWLRLRDAVRKEIGAEAV
ncbi:MAG: hypothetical protein ACOX8W_06580 [bacterium]